MKLAMKLFGAAAAFVLPFSGAANAVYQGMPTGAYAAPPIGHYEFCKRVPVECSIRTAKPKPLVLTQETWRELIEINSRVNAEIVPQTDMETWGQEEYWAYPVNGAGDCDDIVLEKRRQLIDRGFPVSNLLITVVFQPNGEGHAVLTVTTDRGDFILDNLQARILRWSETAYRFHKRQSATDTRKWVEIEKRDGDLVGSIR